MTSAPRPRSTARSTTRCAPGGVLVNLDAAMTRARGSTRWPSSAGGRMAEHGITEAEARGHFAAWADEDRYFPLDEELAALRRAGFAEVECIWRRGARRSAAPCALEPEARARLRKALALRELRKPGVMSSGGSRAGRRPIPAPRGRSRAAAETSAWPIGPPTGGNRAVLHRDRRPRRYSWSRLMTPDQTQQTQPIDVSIRAELELAPPGESPAVEVEPGRPSWEPDDGDFS